MSDNSAQDKTERPSEHRLRKAQEEGNLPRSKELVTALMMIASALLLSAFSDGLAIWWMIFSTTAWPRTKPTPLTRPG